MKGIERNLSSADVSVKWVLILFNLFFLITGMSMIVTGWYLTVYPLTYYNADQMNVTTYEYFFDVRFFSLVNTLYTMGTIIAVISFFGCIGALMESVFILMLFSVCMVTVFITEVTLAATGYVMKDQIKYRLTGAMNIMMHDYESNDASQRTIDTIQKMIGCCGIIGCEDWQENLPMFSYYVPEAEVFHPHEPLHYMRFDTCRVNTSEGVVRVRLPSSCCGTHSPYGECLGVSKDGCIPRLEFLVSRHYYLIAYLIILKLVIGIIACLLAKALYVQKAKRGLKYSLMREELVS